MDEINGCNLKFNSDDKTIFYNNPLYLELKEYDNRTNIIKAECNTKIYKNTKSMIFNILNETKKNIHLKVQQL